uniref:Uncharacterized protein n=1 Tax=Cacopsylla melanoneura TaxID=428564 RepID=A0A8D8W2H4_9HEMI
MDSLEWAPLHQDHCLLLCQFLYAWSALQGYYEFRYFAIVSGLSGLPHDCKSICKGPLLLLSMLLFSLTTLSHLSVLRWVSESLFCVKESLYAHLIFLQVILQSGTNYNDSRIL